MKRLERWIAILSHWWAVPVLALLIVIWGVQQVDLRQLPFLPDPTWARIQQQGQIRIATDASYPPFASLTEEQLFVGLDVDLGQAIASKMGVKAVFANIHWDGLFDALHADKADMVISAVPYDGTLTRDLNYSTAYVDLGLVLVAAQGASLEGGLTGKRVAVELGSAAHLYARQQIRQAQEMELVVANTTEDLKAMLIAGDVGLAICDRVTAGELAEWGEIEMIWPPLVSEPVHVVTASSSSRLASEVNRALDSLRESGELDAIVARWLGGGK